MKTLDVELPVSISEAEAKVVLAMKLFEMTKVTLGQASKIAGVSKREMMHILSNHKIPIANYSTEELAAEVAR